MTSGVDSQASWRDGLKKSLSVLFSIGTALIIIWAGWRLASRRRSLPCPAWLRWFVELDNPFARTNRSSEIIQHLELASGMTVLDIGCGPGRVSIPAAQAVGPEGEVIALDLQPEMLRRVEEKAHEVGLGNVRLLEAGIGTGALDGIQAHRAVLVTVLGEIPDRAAALREIFAALVPDGILSVTETIFDPHYQPRATVTALATAAGFHEDACFGNKLAFTLNLLKPIRTA